MKESYVVRSIIGRLSYVSYGQLLAIHWSEVPYAVGVRSSELLTLC